MQRFYADEEGYQAWVRSHHAGIVVSEKRPKAKLHRADCSHVGYFNENWGPGGRYGYTTKPMLCFDDRADFQSWRATTTSPVPPRCPDCAPALS